MNNSVHYEEEKDTELPTIAIPLSEGEGLYTTKEAAAADGAKSVVIYVERIAAKVTLKQIDIEALSMPTRSQTIQSAISTMMYILLISM